MIDIHTYARVSVCVCVYMIGVRLDYENRKGTKDKRVLKDG